MFTLTMASWKKLKNKNPIPINLWILVIPGFGYKSAYLFIISSLPVLTTLNVSCVFHMSSLDLENSPVLIVPKMRLISLHFFPLPHVFCSRSFRTRLASDWLFNPLSCSPFLCANYVVPIPVEELPQCIGFPVVSTSDRVTLTNSSEELSLCKLANYSFLVVINTISVPSPNQVKIPMTNWLPSHSVFCYCCFTVKTTFRKTSLIRYLLGSWNFPLPTGITSLIQQRYWYFFQPETAFLTSPCAACAQLGRQPGRSRAACSLVPQLLCLFSWFSWTVLDESSGASGCHVLSEQGEQNANCIQGTPHDTRFTSWCTSQHVRCFSCKINVSLNFSLLSLFKKEKLLLYGQDAVGIYLYFIWGIYESFSRGAAIANCHC